MPGVTDVAVDLREGADSPVRVTSSTDLDPAAVRAAVEEAGYTRPGLTRGGSPSAAPQLPAPPRTSDKRRDMSTSTSPAPDTAAHPDREVDLAITGMTCASCSARIERKLNKLDGVRASVNLATNRASVHYAAPLQPQDLVTAVAADRLRRRPSSAASRPPASRPPGRHEGHDLLADRALRLRALVSLALTIPVLLIAMVPPIGDALGAAGPWLELALTTPIVAWAAWPFHRARRGQRPARGLHHGHPRLAGRDRRLRVVAGHDPGRRLRAPLLRGRGRGHHVPARRPLRRVPRPHRGPVRATPCWRWAPRTSPYDGSTRPPGRPASCGCRSTSSWWATTSSSAPARRSPPTASSWTAQLGRPQPGHRRVDAGRHRPRRRGHRRHPQRAGPPRGRGPPGRRRDHPRRGHPPGRARPAGQGAGAAAGRPDLRGVRAGRPRPRAADASSGGCSPGTT